MSPFPGLAIKMYQVEPTKTLRNKGNELQNSSPSIYNRPQIGLHFSSMVFLGFSWVFYGSSRVFLGFLWVF